MLWCRNEKLSVSHKFLINSSTPNSDDSQIFVTPKVAVTVPLAGTEINPEESFTVAIAQSQEVDIPFQWWIVEKAPLTSGEKTN